MRPSGSSLDDFFRAARTRSDSLVLATVIDTDGSTYSKTGAQMLISPDGRSAGLLSGGCLEADLLERARSVLQDGGARLVDYDTRGPDDLIWGIGLGCEGAMTILLTRLSPDDGYQPFALQEACRREQRAACYALVTRSQNPAHPLGQAYWLAENAERSEHDGTGSGQHRGSARPGGAATSLPPVLAQALHSGTSQLPPAACGREAGRPRTVEAEQARFLILPVLPPPRLLVLGAGPDALPLVHIAALAHWQVTVLDHRPAYAVRERFPRAQRVALRAPAELGAELAHERYDAAVVMSHHLHADRAYLEALAASSIPYVGLLGPAPRRARLLAEIGTQAAQLSDRLYGPVGLDIGAATPEAIALAIVAEIQAVHAGRSGGFFSRSAGAPVADR